jgi:hypothetical protein
MRSSPVPGLGGADQSSGLPDFFLWGYIKNIEYGKKIWDIQHLQDRIRAAIATVTPDMIQWTWHKIRYHLDICQETNGAHIKTY